MKKFITLLLAVLLCFGALAGCKKDKPDGDDDKLEGVEYNERSGEMYVDSKEGKSRIKISFTPGFGDEWIKQAARSFLLDELGKSYYFVLDEDSELTTAVSSRLESGINLSDIYFPLASNWYNYASLGYLENLDSLYEMTIPGESRTVGEKITGAWQTYGRGVNNNEEHFYVFPGNENITGIVYNKTLFDKYGWEVPQTVEELEELCAEIVADTSGKVAPFVYPGTVPGGYWDFVGTNWWLQVSGVEKMNEFMAFDSAEVFNNLKQSSPSYGKVKMLETFEKVIVKNRESYTLRGSASKNHTLAQLSFVRGEAAMIPNGSWIENESLENMKDEVRMMYTPRMKEAKDDTVYNYTGQPDYLMIPSGASNKEGAKLFLAYMCKDEMLKQYTSFTGAPRPFDYDVSSCETSEFIKSCLDIWANSTSWFENSTNKLWTTNKIRKFNNTNPYTTLLGDDTITAAGWCAAEYNAVKGDWSNLISSLQ